MTNPTLTTAQIVEKARSKGYIGIMQNKAGDWRLFQSGRDLVWEIDFRKASYFDKESGNDYVEEALAAGETFPEVFENEDRI